MVVLGMVLAAVQWVPSKELLDRSPRAEGLTWAELTYGSWHPELLPTLLVREAYGTRALDTDWMDAFYPYHEMDVYLGALGLSLALIGAGAWRDRWVGFWVALAGLGAVMMLGRYTFLFDRMNRVPVLGSARIPVRYHLWVTLGVAALASVGVDRLSRPGKVRIRGAAWGMLILALVALAIALNAYAPALDGPGRWTSTVCAHAGPPAGRRADVGGRAIGLLAILGWLAIVGASRIGTGGAPTPARRVVAAARPGRAPGRTLARRADGVAGLLDQAPGERRGDPVRPRAGAGRRVRRPDGECAGVRRDADRFLQGARRPGLESAPAWGLHSATGETPLFPRRLLRLLQRGAIRERAQRRRGGDACPHGRGDLPRPGPPPRAGSALIYRNPHAQPRARLMGLPAYADDERHAARLVGELGVEVRRRLVVEDPGRPLPADADASGTAGIVVDEPERVVVETESAAPAYLVLADTFDPGWSAAVDGAGADPAGVRRLPRRLRAGGPP